MADFVVGARFDIKENKIAPAAEATAEQLDKLKKRADEADRALGKLVESQGRGQETSSKISAEYQRAEASLAKYMLRLEPGGRALEKFAEGQVKLQRAYELGVISQDQFVAGQQKVTAAYERSLQSADGLARSKRGLADQLGIGTVALAGFAGGMAASLAGMVATEVGAAALKVAYQVLSGETQRSAQSQKILNDLFDQAAPKVEALNTLSGKAAAAARQETASKQALIETELTRLEIERERLRVEERGSRTASSTLGYRAQGEALDAMIKTSREKLAALRRDISVAEQASSFLPPDSVPTGSKNAGAARAQSVSAGERDLIRHADAALKAAGAINEYRAATDDMIEKMDAERSGRLETIAQIELEAQIRKRHGIQAVDTYQNQIRAAALERAAVERNRAEWKAFDGFVNSSADSIGNAIQTSLLAPLDASGQAMKNLGNVWLNVVNQIISEATKLTVINPILNGLFGGNRQTISGGLFGGFGGGSTPEMSMGGGGLGGIFSGILGFITSLFHEGGIVGKASVSRVVPAAVFDGAQRAHRGAYLTPGEVPVIAKEGEAVFTPRQMDNANAVFAKLADRNEASANVQVVINDMRSGNAAPVETRQRAGAGGLKILEVTIRDTVKNGIVRGDFDSAAQSAWGVTRRGAR